MIALILIVLLVSFLTGSIPNAFLISKIFYKIDIRNYGSGNPGATNVWRVIGKIPGTLTFLFDVLKGFIPVFIVRKMFAEPSLTVPMLSGFCAVAGHIWTPFLKLRGGKGVATGYGVFLGLAPLSAIFSLIVFSVVLIITKYIALGSISAAISLPVFLYFFNGPVILKYVSVVLAIIIVWRHMSNIKKILSKTED